VVSLFVQVAGALLFLPAASIPNFWLFLTLSSSWAPAWHASDLGQSLRFRAGPEHSAPIRQNLAQAFNSIGGMIAPVVAGALILKHKVCWMRQHWRQNGEGAIAYKISIAGTVRMPYLAIAAALVLLALRFPMRTCRRSRPL